MRRVVPIVTFALMLEMLSGSAWAATQPNADQHAQRSPSTKTQIKPSQYHYVSKLLQYVNSYAYREEDRVTERVEDNSSGELSAVGRVHTFRGDCTGFIIEHAQILVTNAHCFFAPSPDTTALQKHTDPYVKFTPGYNNGRGMPIRGKLIAIGHTEYNIHRADDYAVIVLEKPARVKPLPSGPGPKPNSKNTLLASYSDDEETRGEALSLVMGCPTAGMDSIDGLNHFCSALPGGSGGLLATAKLKYDENGHPTGYSRVRAVGIYSGGRGDKNGRPQSMVPMNDSTVNRSVPIERPMAYIKRAIIQLERERRSWEKVDVTE